MRTFGIKLALEKVHRPPQKMRLFAQVQPHIVCASLKPLHVVGAKKYNPSRRADHQAVQERARGAHALQQSGYPPVQPIALLAPDLKPGALQGLMESAPVERLQEVVESVGVECWQCVAVIGRHEITTGRCVSPILSSTPKPSTSGIWTSRSSRSGASRAIAATAEGPSAHSATALMSGSALNNLRSLARASSSSSTIIV